MSEEKKGDELFAKAEQSFKSKSKGLSFWPFNKKDIDYYEVVDQYKKAGNLYILAKAWKKAAESYENAASAATKGDDTLSAATLYVEASKCYKNFQPDLAIKVLDKASAIYFDKSMLDQYGRIMANIAEIYELNVCDPSKALEYYQKAADIALKDNFLASSSKYLTKVAECLIATEKYLEAGEIYEKLGTSCLTHSTLKYRSKNFFFKSALCTLSAELLAGQEVLSKFMAILPEFPGSIEYNLINTINDAVNNNDSKMVEEAIKEYRMRFKFDETETKVVEEIIRKANEEIGY